MSESNFKNFNHLKTHTQYSICEGAIKIDDLKDRTKELKIKALGICDTSNLCGAVEFSDKLSKVGTQPIIGTQINFKFEDTIGLLPLFALDENGYKKIIELSSKSYLENDELSDPHIDFEELLEDNEGVALFCDDDFIWECDPLEVLYSLDVDKAVSVVQHNFNKDLSGTKLDNQKNVMYPKKLWSSFMVFNNAHEDCKKLTPEVVNTASGNKYYIDNVQQDTLNFIKTGTYTFSQTDSTNETHPLRFYTAADKSGGEYTTGVTTFGTPGVTEGAYTRIVVDSSAPATLYYQCSSHAEMGGQINVTEVTDNQLTGVTRGAFGSTAAAHNSGVAVRLLLTPANNYYFTAGSNATTGQINGGGYNVSSGPVTLKTIGPQA